MISAGDAQAFFDFYLKGGDLDDLTGAFGGIRRRQPAAVSDPPEYEPLPAALEEFDSLLIPKDQLPRMNQDFNPNKIMLLDLCAAERAVVLASPPGIEIVVLWVSDYPASEFPTVREVQPDGRIVTADTGQPHDVVLNECVNRLWEFAAADLVDVPVDARVVQCAFEDLDRTEQQVRQREL